MSSCSSSSSSRSLFFPVVVWIFVTGAIKAAGAHYGFSGGAVGLQGGIVSDGRQVLRPCGLRGPGQQNSGHSFSRGAKGRDAGILNLPSL